MLATVQVQDVPLSAQIFTLDRNETGSSVRPCRSCDGTSFRTLAHHEHIFYEGAESKHVYEILEGVVCVYKVMSDGRRQVISFCYPGDVIGLGCGEDYLHSAETITDVKVRVMPVRLLESTIRERPEIGQKLVQLAYRELASARDRLLTLGRRSALERVATFVVELSHRNHTKGDDPEVIDLPMTRTDIADFLGLTIETVCRNLTRLKIAGIIDLHEHKTIEINDIQQLKEVAEGDSVLA